MSDSTAVRIPKYLHRKLLELKEEFRVHHFWQVIKCLIDFYERHKERTEEKSRDVNISSIDVDVSEEDDKELYIILTNVLKPSKRRRK